MRALLGAQDFKKKTNNQALQFEVEQKYDMRYAYEASYLQSNI